MTKIAYNCIISNFRRLINISLFLGSLAVFYSCSTGRSESDNEENIQPSKTMLRLQSALQILTSRDSDHRLSLIDTLQFEDLSQPDEHFPTLLIDPKKTFQTIEGFGGALTDASAETFYKLPESKQEEILTAYFDAEKGLGYTLCRTHINSCDFSSESYAYTEVEGDTELKYFSIEKDKHYRIPFILAAQKKANNNINLFVSPWSPPAWMKTNNNMLQGGKLKPEYYQTWADYYVRFIDEYKKAGIPIWGLTVQNEPMAVQSWESCIFTAEEEKDFVKDFLGPTLENSGMSDKKIIIWDHNRGIMYQRAMVAYDDPEASKYIWGTGFHWYTGDHFENLKLVQEAFPDKKTLFTEGCVFPFDYNKLSEWNWGERYGESIIHDLNNSAVGWVDWNILLDETGGPNHVANYCYAPVIGNTITGEVLYMNSFYYLGHFSKFIKPGAKRIICSSNFDDLLATAAINRDGSIVVVAMNQTDKDIEFRIWIENKAITAKSPNHSIASIIFN
jgi:glucosylceramidase